MGSSYSKPINPPAAVDEKTTAYGHGQERDRELNQQLSNLTLASSSTTFSDGSLAIPDLREYERDVAATPAARLARTTLSKSSLPSTLLLKHNLTSTPHIFSNTIPTSTGPITSQRSSGRCWLFASTNLLRHNISATLSLPDFQLSQAYLFFYDKLEKANYFLENNIELMREGKELDDRVVNHLARSPVSDGGQWDMVVNLLEKYGVIPGVLFPDAQGALESGPVNKILTTRLRAHVMTLREINEQLELNKKNGLMTEESVKAHLRKRKEDMVKEVWNVLTATLGVPPGPNDEIKWEYLDVKGKAKEWKGTPREFYKAFTSKVYPATEAFSLIHDPRNDRNKLYTVERLGNIWGARPILYVNTEIERLKAAVVKSIKAGQPVFFGCDVGQSSDRISGVMDLGLYDFETPFQFNSDVAHPLTKTQRLQLNESAMTHAMVISAVHIDPESGRPVRFKVENSWGEEAGEKGWFVMSEKWFDQFVYQVVIPRQLADKDLLKVFDSGDKVVLPPWDPMGALA
ncbi:hypothetical protein M422DRAFT_58073 [Sphaerobolus stellatus SS14]|nr:hypothetical protein M422DRAFT_58073 [Sphaerobolus stellatus SS14]